MQDARAKYIYFIYAAVLDINQNISHISSYICFKDDANVLSRCALVSTMQETAKSLYTLNADEITRRKCEDRENCLADIRSYEKYIAAQENIIAKKNELLSQKDEQISALEKELEKLRNEQKENTTNH